MAEYQYINASGVIIADTADVLTEVQNEFKNAFGQDLVVTPDTPQGVLITAETEARSNVLRNNAALANQINPNIAGGVFLDAIMALTGSERDTAQRSTVTATITGVPSTLIPAGVTAATSPGGDLFELTTAVAIPDTGIVTALFQSVAYGPIPAASGALSNIIDGVLGWETVTNTDAATLGQETQSDAAARLYRRNTLALQGTSLAEAITSALYATEGVRSLSFRENVANTTQTIDGISMVAHSMYACVDGGTDANVAAAIVSAKSGGCNYNGGVTVAYTDPYSGQTGNVKFDRPDPLAILARVTILTSGTIANPVTAVKDAIVAYANGELDGEPGFTVGSDVSSFELAGAVNRQYPSIYVQKVEISLASSVVWSTDPIVIGLDQIATISASSVTVVEL